MHITIFIPTINRIEKLRRVIKSIQEQTHLDWDLYIMADNYDLQTLDWVDKNYSPKDKIIGLINSDHGYIIGCINRFMSTHISQIRDSFLFLCDDVELYPDTLEILDKYFQEKFPDGDGVVGISQKCPGHPEYTYKPYGQSVLGKKFIERYADVNFQVSCSEYTHFFQDEEMWQYAASINKFSHCKDAFVNHYHPSFIKEEMDSTHGIVRGPLFKKDQEIFQKRQAKGLIWGKTFEKL